MAFLLLFIFFYKKSGKFRKSLIAALAASTLHFSLLSSQPAQAAEAEAFTTPNQQHISRLQNQGFFSSKSNADGSGPGKPSGNNDTDNDDSDISTPKYPMRESVEDTEKYLVNMDKHISKLQQLEDSESETEETECKIKSPGKFQVDFDFELDQNGKPTLIIPIKDGTIRRIEFDQTRNKWYHADLFPSISAPDGFNNRAVRDMKYPDRLAYLRANIPDKSVIELQNQIGKSLSDPENISVPGFLGKHKSEGTIDINMESGLVSFTDKGSNKHRTIVRMPLDTIKELAENDFHLFPEK